MRGWKATAVAIGGCAALLAGCGRGERTAAADYQHVLPAGLPRDAMVIPVDNPMTAAKVALGKQLYFDPRLSVDSTVSCASCHNPRFGFGDGQRVSTGVRGQKGTRNSPTIVNRVFSAAQFWDGRAASLEEQAKGPIANPIEMGFTHEGVVARLQAVGGYPEEFARVFGAGPVTIDRIAQAIAAYERTVVTGNSPYDRFVAGDTTALSPAARRGMLVFMGKGACAQCHVGFNFTDEKYHNLGVGFDGPHPDSGRYAVSKRTEDVGAFRTPSLRDVALSAPYLHDGSAGNLAAVVEVYNRGGTPNAHLSPLMKPLRLSVQEKADLVAFMEALTGDMPMEAMAPPLPR
jgi:cytochrome c peroxidase